MSRDDELSFIATISIRGYPVSFVRDKLATQWEKVSSTRFYFRHVNGFYTLQVIGGAHDGRQINTNSEGFLVVSNGANSFKLLTTTKAPISLKDIPGDQKTVYLQTQAGYYVQQNMEGWRMYGWRDRWGILTSPIPRLST